MNPHRRLAPLLAPRFSACIFAASSAWLSAVSLCAADISWSPPLVGAGGDTLWSNSQNWTGGFAPANDTTTDFAVFSDTTAYNFQPALDAFTVRSVHGLKIGGASSQAITISAGSGSRSTSGSAAINSSALSVADATGLAVGQLVGGTGIPLGAFVTAINGNTVTLSRPTSAVIGDAASLTFTSSLRLGAGGISLLAGTANDNNTLTAPLVLAASQEWNAGAARRLNIQGSVFLDNHTLTLKGVTGSTISFNGANTTQSIGGSGSIVVDTDGTVSFGPGSGGRQQNSFTGGVTLNKGRISLQGGNSGGTGTMGGLGTGVLTINGGEINGGGNIAGRSLTISGQVWNADWTYSGARAIDMGTGAITLGTAAGTSRTVTATDSNIAYVISFNGGISNGTTANTFIKAGVGHVSLGGVNTYTGDTQVTGGSLTLASTGALTFYIGANGVNNRVDGSGTFNANGTFIFDTSGAALIDGNSWTIVNVATLAESFSATFLVQNFTETALDSGVWTNGGGLTFTEATGLLSYSAVPEPSAFALLGGVSSLLLAFTRRRPVRRS